MTWHGSFVLFHIEYLQYEYKQSTERYTQQLAMNTANRSVNEPLFTELAHDLPQTVRLSGCDRLPLVAATDLILWVFVKECG